MILVCVAAEAEAKGFKWKENEVLRVTGIGKVNAALSIPFHLAKNVVNLGTAGGIKNSNGYQVINPKQFVDRDADPLFKDEFYPPVMQATGWVCSTGDQFHKGAMTQGVCYDMEAYAIARGCERNQVSFSCYKVITDAGSFQDWELNLPGAMQHLWDYYYKNVYPELSGQTPSDR